MPKDLFILPCAHALSFIKSLNLYELLEKRRHGSSYVVADEGIDDAVMAKGSSIRCVIMRGACSLVKLTEKS